MSIRTRLTLWYSSILAVILVLFGITLYALLSFSFYSDVRFSLKSQAENIGKQMYVVNLSSSDIYVHMPPLDFFQSNQFYMKAVDEHNTILQKSMNLRDFYLPHQNLIDKVKNADGFYEKASVGKVDMMIYDSPIYVHKQVIGVLQVAMPIENISDSLNKVTPILIITGLIALVLTATVGWFLTSQFLKPIHRIILETDHIEKGADLKRRIPDQGPNDEIGKLTRKINGMLSRLQIVYGELEESYRAQRRFVSDASHELRTPLTTIRGNVDLLQKMWDRFNEEANFEKREEVGVMLETMQDIAGEAERMSRLVNDLLALARADAGYQMELQSLLLRPIVEDVARRAQFLANEQVVWEIGDLSPLDDVTVIGNSDYLQQLLYIFLDNAFKYTNEGFVRLDATRSDKQIGIRIKDTGIGMDQEEVPNIFNRFYRADLSRGKTVGTGLGLSIAKWIIDEQNGSIEVLTKKDKGTTFILWLPISFQSHEKLEYNEEERD